MPLASRLLIILALAASLSQLACATPQRVRVKPKERPNFAWPDDVPVPPQLRSAGVVASPAIPLQAATLRTQGAGGAMVTSGVAGNFSSKCLVIGTPRSGTSFAAKSLRNLGLKVAHEMPDFKENDLDEPTDALVSWWFAGDAPFPSYAGPGLPARHYIFQKVVHIVRDPLEVIKTVPTMYATSFAFIQRHAHLPSELVRKNPLKYAALFWMRWNKLAEWKADVRLKIEDQDAASLCEACGWHDTCHPSAYGQPEATAPEDTNTREDHEKGLKNVTAAAIREVLNDEDAGEFFALARKYGYDYGH